MSIIVLAHTRAGRQVRTHQRKGAGGWSRIEPAVGGGGKKTYGGHAFRVTTRAGVKKTIFRHGKYADVAKAVKRLQNRMRGGINYIQHLP